MNPLIDKFDPEVEIYNSEILIVDDQKEIALLTVKFLNSFGYKNVRIALTTNEAREIVFNSRIDLILMDINLNDKIDGIDLVNEMNNNYEGSIIYLTGRFEDEILKKAKHTYPAGYILKPYDSKLLKAQVEIALHSRLIQQENISLKRALIQTIQAMEKTVAMKDPYTADHQSRVSKLAEAIAVELNLDNHTIEGIRYAGLLHEFGKIFVPAEILSKPGKLSEVQFNFIREHPLKGYEALTDINFPWPLAEIVLQHHERLDGSGYPLGLTGDDIRIESKIISVADVVSSITTYKSYRPAKSLKVALEEIENNKNSETGEIVFDPDVVATCLKLFRTNAFTF